ncbi:MAG: cysteine desulfurase [Sphaerochaetaceae bacterium]|nr:cysteine desulfurase [Sphaerochaetaceae bacterium]
MNLKELREDFPLLKQEITYFDNAATTPTCKTCIDLTSDYYEKDCFNIHRGGYKGSLRSEGKIDEARALVKSFINAESKKEIIFTSGATESLNLIATSLFCSMDFQGKNIVTTELEHHSNFIPWIMGKAEVKIATSEKDGKLRIKSVLDLIDEKTGLLTITACSNVTGDFIDLKDIIKKAHQKGAFVIVDASQYIAHRKLDVQELNCDFAVFSGHKIYGPTGIGVLYGKSEIMESLNPPKFGGDMVLNVMKQEWLPLPSRFEAGTLNLAGIVGMGGAIQWMEKQGLKNIEEREKNLKSYLFNRISEIEGVKMFSRKENSAPIVSFSMEGINSNDIAMFLATKEICVRSGKLCAQPLLARIDVESLVRVSLSFLNTEKEIDFLISSLRQIKERVSKWKP